MKYLFFSLLALTFIGCSKDSTSTSLESALVSKRFALTSVKYTPQIDFDGNGTLESEVFNLLDACEKDDVIYFKSSSAAESIANVKCYSFENDIDTYRLSIFDKGFVLDNDTIFVSSYNSNSFSVTEFEPSSTTAGYNLISIYTAQ